MSPRLTVAILAVGAVLAASPAAAQLDQIPPASEWRDVPSLAPAVTDQDERARMNDEIRAAIAQSNGDDDAARRAIQAIVQRYTENAAQAARNRPK